MTRTSRDKSIRKPASGLITRRDALKGAGLALGGAAVGGLLPHRAAWGAGSDAPIKLGFQCHRTGIGSAYGKWYEITTNAAVKLINESGGIANRPIELIVEDDGTDPKRGAEVVEKLASQHQCDLIFGTLFSHVVIGSAPRAGELKIPYFVVSEGYHVASGALNRYVFQPGITDVRAQVTSLAPWISENLGKKVAMIFPDYAFGHDHRDFFTAAIQSLGGSAPAHIPVAPTETTFSKYFAQIPADTEVLYHVMVGPGVLTFVKEMGEHFGSQRPNIFGFIDSLEAVDLASPGLEFLEGTYIWEAMPRFAGQYDTPFEKFYREKVGVDANGASTADAKDIATYSHMFGCWETLYVIKQAIEASGYQMADAQNKQDLIEAVEAMESFEESNEHPQGPKKFVGKIHQCFGQQFVSQVEGGKLKVVHKTAIEDGMYPPQSVDYTTQPL